MTLRKDIESFNPETLTSSRFLVNLALSFGVSSIPLAIFILVCICLAIGLLLILIIYFVRIQLKQKFMRKKRPNYLDGVYVDEIPGEKGDDLASVEFTLEYNLSTSELKVGLNQMNRLTSLTKTSMVNAFVLITVFRVVSGTKQTVGKALETKPLCRSSHHCWQQIVTNVINPKELPSVSIRFEVFDKDSFGYCYQCIGKMEVFLKDIEFQNYGGQIYEHFGWLQPGEAIKKMDGELCIGLCYDHFKAEIDVIIYEAKNISLPVKIIDTTGSQGYLNITIELVHNKKRVDKKEVRCKQISNNPYLNAKTTFKVNRETLREYKLICIVEYCRRFGRRQKLSMAKVGAGSTPSGLCHWDRMVNGPCSIHGMWQPLVPLVKAKRQ